MTSFLHIGDVHLSDTPPGWRTDTYRQAVLDKLTAAIGIANAREVDAVLIAGDLFHHRTRVAHALIADTIDVLHGSRAPVHILPGNHDLRENRLETAPRQPIGLVARALNVPLATERFSVVGPDKDYVQVIPVPYIHGMTVAALSEYVTQRVVLNTPTVVWVHNSVTPTDDYPFPVLSTDSPDWNVPGELVIAGHIHDDLGLWQTSTGQKCLNFGALSRGSLTTAALDFKPSVALVSFDGPDALPTVEKIPVPHRPASEVFRVEERDAKVSTKEASEDFVAALSDTSLPSSFTVDDLERRIHESDVEQPVRDAAVAAVQEVW